MSFSHNANGNITAKGNRVFVYTADDRLGQVFLGNNQPIAAYLYDLQGKRLRKHAGGQIRFFHYDQDGHLVAETDETGALVRGYVRLDGLPLAMVTADGSMYYYHTDHLGTPLRLTDASGTVVWAADYQPFGKADLLVNTVENNLRFPGQYFDTETGLHYNWNRYYDPETGRYITPDPIGLEGGLNLYAYVGNDPVNKIDPEGLAGCYVGYPGYPITIPGTNTKIPFIHAGVLSYNNRGNARYYEYGRYGSDFGKVQRQEIPDLLIGPDGKPTPESWAKLQAALDKIGHGIKAKTSCEDKADADKINNFAEQRMNDPGRAPYSWNPFDPNTCTTFASDALEAGLK